MKERKRDRERERERERERKKERKRERKKETHLDLCMTEYLLGQDGLPQFPCGCPLIGHKCSIPLLL